MSIEKNQEVRKMSNNGDGDGFRILVGLGSDSEIVKNWRKAFEATEEVLPEAPDVAAIIAAQPPPAEQEDDPPPKEYTGLCSGCIRPGRGLCPCNDIGVNFDPKGVNVDLAVRPFDEQNELISG